MSMRGDVLAPVLGEVVKPLHPRTRRWHPATVLPSLAAPNYRDNGLVQPPIAAPRLAADALFKRPLSIFGSATWNDHHGRDPDQATCEYLADSGTVGLRCAASISRRSFMGIA